jgi:hypothetical protein
MRVSIYPDHIKELELHFRYAGSPERCFVRSRSISNHDWLVDLEGQTCSCPDFQKFREKMPINYMGRLCKHLLQTLNETKQVIFSSRWSESLFEDGHGGPLVAWEIVLQRKNNMAVTAGLSEAWLNVIANLKDARETTDNANGPLTVFGWSVHEKRWAYGEAPPGSKQIKPILLKYGQSFLRNSEMEYYRRTYSQLR